MVVLLLVYPKKMNETDALVRPVSIYDDSDDEEIIKAFIVN